METLTVSTGGRHRTITEALFNPIETHTLNHKAYLSLSQNLRTEATWNG